jgi:4-amino-4-deoxy-L-arabinose transferase-like glycosyltransferase
MLAFFVLFGAFFYLYFLSGRFERAINEAGLLGGIALGIPLCLVLAGFIKYFYEKYIQKRRKGYFEII